MKRKYTIIFFLLLPLQFLAQKQYNNQQINISIEQLKNSIEYFGSDSLAGRETGSKGAELAAEFIADQLKSFGLTPIGNNQNYFQNVPIHESIPLKESALTLYTENESTKFQLEKDYFIYKSGDQTFIPSPLPLIFVGYGIIAPEFDYNDYQAVDVEGKIVVMLSGEPNSNEDSYFNGENTTIYSYSEAKQRIAISRGASGCIIIPNPANNLYKKWEDYKTQFYFENMSLAYSVSSNLNILFNPVSAQILFKDSDYLLQDIYEMDNKNKILSFPLKTKLSFAGQFKEKDFISNNVATILQGSDSDLSNTYLIISAHYDHLGIGPAVNGDSIYNGVFDNAAGVAAVLEIARAFASLSEKPKRSILFLFLTGEEKGLLGSSFYTDFPLVPLYKTIANINVDGISLFDEIKSIIGIGSEFSTLKKYLEVTANSMELFLTQIPPQFEEQESFYLSDQIAFAQAGIPALLLMEGGDYKNLTKAEGLKKLINYGNNIYHRPSDDLNQKINYQAADQFIKIIFDLCLNLANSEVTPEWNENSPFKNIRLKTIAEKR